MLPRMQTTTVTVVSLVEDVDEVSGAVESDAATAKDPPVQHLMLLEPGQYPECNLPLQC